MRGRGRRSIAALALAVGASGCVTGHLLDYGRRREQVVTVHEAFTSGDRLVVHYTALVTDDADAPLAEGTRWATIPLSALGTGSSIPVDGSLPVFVDGAAPASVPEPIRVVSTDDLTGPGRSRRPAALVVRDTTIPAAAFTTTRTAPWVYPLLPATLAIDAATTPVLLFFAPAVVVVGQ